ncbi:MAG TPA: lysophospholipase, partial [Acidaminococcaceae bacterium]|nr:lysophospholipase [Acidaminococcaceae bacterium]
MNTIACFGDSLIEGFPFAQENSWVAQVEKVTELRMLNHGVCGECCDD